MLPDGSLALHQADTGMVHAAATVAILQRLAVERGAVLREHTPAHVLSADSSGVTVATPTGRISCGRVVVTADAWTNEVVAALDLALPLTVTKEQVSYFAPDRAEDFAPGRFPVWIWMDDPSFYGFPTFGEAAVKSGQDVGGSVTTGDDRDFDPGPGQRRPADRVHVTDLPGQRYRRAANGDLPLHPHAGPRLRA